MSKVLEEPTAFHRPQDVGILAMEIYFPYCYVDQNDLEDFDQISKGKYTIGLGQQEMGFCSDNEDINSLCLTVVATLMEKHHICYSQIGRLEVGTETIIDKSKSVKTVLMQLFEESGNFSVEGIDTTNACYGGTSALFNAISWVESSAWDGRYALVVCGDIAVYSSGNARCTGGAGAAAILVGPFAPLIIEPGLRGTYMHHAYDFYKPDLTSEYPVVDGELSVKSYITALYNCYQTYCHKADKLSKSKGPSFCLEDVDYFAFHSPYCKLVQKSLSRLTLIDFVKDKVQHYSEQQKCHFSKLFNIKIGPLEESLFDRELEKTIMGCSRSLFESKTLPSLLMSKRVGNMYTPSLYSCLASLLICKTIKDLRGKRVGMFSYGSGLAASMFSIRIADATVEEQVGQFTLERLVTGLSDIPHRLECRQRTTPEQFTTVLQRREKTHLRSAYEPEARPQNLFPGTYYLTRVDDKFRRFYERKPGLRTNGNCNSANPGVKPLNGI